jgi:hypothetical protein
MKRPLLALALLSASGAAVAAEASATPSIDEALRLAARQHRPVLIDFQAVWCYSCYYMASHVLNGPEWQEVERKAIFVEADADSPEGQQWMQKLKIGFLPSYAVLDERGEELGRILAEQPREKFYPAIGAILDHGDTLDALSRQAAAGSEPAVVAVLNAYQARGEGRPGLDWFAALPGKVRERAAADPKAALALERLRLAQAKDAHDNQAVVASARKALAGDIGCDRPYVLDDLLEASEKQPEAQRRQLLAEQREPLDDYLATHVFVAAPACADQRSAVLASADLDAALGDRAAETAVLDRAIALSRQKLGDDLASDRNVADNLRVYLARAGRSDELDAYQRKLIDAYPDDYVYAYRYGRSLLEQGKPAAALPWLERAADKAYGANRLSVAAARVKALKALDRRADAEKVVADVLKDNGPWFPKQAAQLKASLQSS